MTIIKHELKQGALSLAIWSVSIAALLAACILIYPEMGRQMDDVSNIFSEMGGFSAAFGMDRLNFGEFTGFFGVECGNVLGLGGAFFAALLGISVLSKEEKDQTAEFLLTHPVSREHIVTGKLCAMFLQILLLNLLSIAATWLCIKFIGESPDGKTLALLFLAYFLLQLEISSICFGISAFLRRGGLGIGLGLSAMFYFLNIIANLTEQTRFLKYITPFGYTDSADIIIDQKIPMEYLSVGLIVTITGITAAYLRYRKKDILT